MQLPKAETYFYSNRIGSRTLLSLCELSAEIDSSCIVPEDIKFFFLRVPVAFTCVLLVKGGVVVAGEGGKP